MNKVNRGLIVVIFILGLSVIGLGSYIVYDKLLNDDGNINDFDNDNEDSKLLTNEEALIISKELGEKYFDYDNQIGAYCGKTNSDDYISFGSYETNDFRDYWASTQFKSISELKEYYESLMVFELIPNYIDDGVTYIEKDGKLYCQLSHKGGGFSRDYDVESTYNIRSIKEDIIVFDVTFWGYDMSTELSSFNAVITIVKNSDGGWLVSKYEINN